MVLELGQVDQWVNSSALSSGRRSVINWQNQHDIMGDMAISKSQTLA